MFKKRLNIIIATITVCLVAALPAAADNHALLIGIGQYQQRTLEGPPHDVAALAEILEAQYDFPAENIRTLVNGAAVKRRILAEIQQLTYRTRPGDRIFIYFSGHGTSRRDELLALPLPHSTGALVPADFNATPDQPVSRLLSQLIIGRRDLRPTLAQLDRDREVLMVFDTCFSGNTVRATQAPEDKRSSRYLKLATPNVFGAEQEIGKFEENLDFPDPYPYRNIFYISASSEYEVARDIRRDNLHLYPTIDGNPHGVLTDSLLRVLAGQRPVDTDRDGRWSQIELFTAVKADVKRRFTQTPRPCPDVAHTPPACMQGPSLSAPPTQLRHPPVYRPLRNPSRGFKRPTIAPTIPLRMPWLWVLIDTGIGPAWNMLPRMPVKWLSCCKHRDFEPIC